MTPLFRQSLPLFRIIVLKGRRGKVPFKQVPFKSTKLKNYTVED